MKALVTGSKGFVGQHLTRELLQNGYTVTGIDLLEDSRAVQVNLLKALDVMNVVERERPDVVFHLAAQASVALSWKKPRETMEMNVMASLNLLEAVRKTVPQAKIILIGSADQYGRISSGEEKIVETHPTLPQNMYAISKNTQEDIAKFYAANYSMRVCLTRSFNHSGPGQNPGFLISDLCSGIAAVEQGQAKVLGVGNLMSVRDFTDVRDVVRCYRLLAEKGESGEIYNVGTGTGYRGQAILDMLLDMSRITIRVEQMPELMRASDTPVLICDNTKVCLQTGWCPEIPIKQTLLDTLNDFRSKGTT